MTIPTNVFLPKLCVGGAQRDDERNVSTILRQSRFEFKLGRLALSAVD
jgi:hypothetical protein